MRKRPDVSCSVTVRYSERGLLGRPKHREEEFLLDMGPFAGSLYIDERFSQFGRGCQEHGESLERMSK